MATFRDRPYMQFNFLVDLGDGVTEGPKPDSRKSVASAWRSPSREYRAATPGKTAS